MSEPVREPTDAEFSALLDEVAPDRMRTADNTPEPEPVVPEPAVAAAPPVAEPVAAEPAVEDLPEKYRGKSPAEIAQMHSELEQRLGQQGQELGELRRVVTERLSTPAAEPVVPPWESPDTLSGFEEYVLTNPQAALSHITTNQPQLYDRAIEVWGQLDPLAASRYDARHVASETRAQYDAQLAALRQPVVQSQNDQMLQQAYVNVANKNPLLAQVAADIPALMEENPEFKVLLGNGDIPTRERALNNLVSIAAQRRGVAQSPDPEAVAQAAAQKKVAATVVSGSAGADRPSGENPVDQMKQRLLVSEGTSVQDELARNRAAAITAGTRRA